MFECVFFFWFDFVFYLDFRKAQYKLYTWNIRITHTRTLTHNTIHQHNCADNGNIHDSIRAYNLRDSFDIVFVVVGRQYEYEWIWRTVIRQPSINIRYWKIQPKKYQMMSIICTHVYRIAVTIAHNNVLSSLPFARIVKWIFDALTNINNWELVRIHAHPIVRALYPSMFFA